MEFILLLFVDDYELIFWGDCLVKWKTAGYLLKLVWYKVEEKRLEDCLAPIFQVSRACKFLHKSSTISF